MIISRRWIAPVVIASASLGMRLPRREPDCNAPTAAPIVHIEVPGSPFTAVPSADGCWIFVTLPQPRDSAGIAVLRRADGKVKLEHLYLTPGSLTGAVLSHDGATLIAAAGSHAVFFDTRRLTAGSRDAQLGAIGGEVANAGRVYVNVTRDDRWVFVSDENAMTITVIDIARARRSGYNATAIVGKIPVGRAPIALTFSPDEKYLYTTSQEVPPGYKWPISCRPQGAPPAVVTPNHVRGAILIVDVERAKKDPATSVVAAVPAGCNPVRLVLSPKSDIAYVSARTDNALLAFDTSKLLTDSAHALIGSVPVGTAPVGIALIEDGAKIVVTNSNRFAGASGDRQVLSVIDASKIRDGASAVLGMIPAGAFPREMRVTADQGTLVVTNFASRTVQLIDLTRLSEAMRR